MKPDFLGIGAQKCATSWIYEILREHPDVFMARGLNEKDTRFFSEHFDKGYEWYERHYEKRTGQKIAGEFSTSYFCHGDAPKRIHDYKNDIKLIVCLRNPVDRAFSQHKHNLRLGFISEKNLLFENAVKDNPTYINQSLYYFHLERWLEWFDEKQLLILFYEDLVSNPQKFSKDIFSFLDIDIDFSPPSLHAIKNKSFLYRNDLLNKLKDILFHFMIKIKLGFLINFAKKMKFGCLYKKINTKQDEYSFIPMKEETRKRMLSILSNDIDRLSREVKRDLSFWIQ